MGDEGERFNVGEATLTRCAVRVRLGTGNEQGGDTGAASTQIGLGYVLGRDVRQAEQIALLDALLNSQEHHDQVQARVLRPLQDLQQQRSASQAARVDATRVRFYTLAPDAAT